MEAANLHKGPRPSTTLGPGELVLQNGRQAGARRPLGASTTFIGRTESCDIRLNVDGVDPMHCLVVVSPDGVQLRDLNSLHGTYVNGARMENAILRHGDMLKVGPFQFRVELVAVPIAESDPMPLDDYRATLRIQAAAVAAQQVALEEEEARLQQRRSDLQQQEEQLAAHLAEKQRQIQLWSEYTKSERATLRKEKIDQEKRMDKLEQEVLQARQLVNADHQKLNQQRQRVNKVYQRLRQRWQRQWAAEKEKYQKHARKLQAEALTLEDRQGALQAREATLAQDISRFNTERELGVRQLQATRDALTNAQQAWRRRRSSECLVLKAKQRETDEAQLKLKQVRQLLVQNKDAWERQFATLEKELHGLNNRIVHQRERVQEQTNEIARLDALRRERRLRASAGETDASDSDEWIPECEVVILADEPELVNAVSAPDGQRRFDSLDRMASDLADQRVQLIEQYNRLAEIQEFWQRQRDQAATALETLAQRLLGHEQTLLQRDHQASLAEMSLQKRQQEIGAVRQEIQLWRAQLKAREQTFEQEHHQQMLALQQKETLLQEQLEALTRLRQAWNRRRQQETEQLRYSRALLAEQQKQAHQLRETMLEQGLQVEEEQRILAEKALALEQYRQEVFFRANDPAAQRRVERLRRRWLTINAVLIRNAKSERETVRTDLQQLAAQRAESLKTLNQITETETALAEKQTQLDEREAELKARQLQLEQELGNLQTQRHESEATHLRLQDEVDTLAKAVYDQEDPPAIDKAA